MQNFELLLVVEAAKMVHRLGLQPGDLADEVRAFLGPLDREQMLADLNDAKTSLKSVSTGFDSFNKPHFAMTEDPKAIRTVRATAKCWTLNLQSVTNAAGTELTQLREYLNEIRFPYGVRNSKVFFPKEIRRESLFEILEGFYDGVASVTFDEESNDRDKDQALPLKT